MLSKEVVDILRCPKCRGPLHEVPAPHGLHCESCALLFAIIDGIALIPIEGTLVHKGAYVGAYSGRTSYEGLQAQVLRAMRNPAIKGVVFEVDSFGGELAGVFEARRASIDQTVVGNMGTMYRVRVGPYASAHEGQAVCGRLKGSGLDCLVVSQ